MRFLWGLAGLLFCTLSFANTSGLEGAVKIGNSKVDHQRLAGALDQCRTHEPKLAPPTCIEQFWIPRWLMDKQAEDEKLISTPAIDYLFSELLQEKLTVQISRTSGNPDEESINQYLRDHQRDFEKPLRIRVFRILLATASEAEAIIAKLGPSTTVEEFRKIARAKSIDNATHERGGDLGFLWPNGSTDIPQISCDTNLYEAALKLEDGQFSPTPIAEGKRFAVLWRRGTKPAIQKTKKSRQIARLRVIEKNTEDKIQQILRRLNDERVKDRKNILLGKLRRKEAKLFNVP